MGVGVGSSSVLKNPEDLDWGALLGRLTTVSAVTFPNSACSMAVTAASQGTARVKEEGRRALGKRNIWAPNQG